jgi:hypothetical protein
MYLSTILDDFSPYAIVWKLRSGMTSRDVTETLEHYFYRVILKSKSRRSSITTTTSGSTRA